MLPDFPSAKNRLKKFWDQYADDQQKRALGYFANMQSHHHYEGDSWVTNREDGSSSESNYKEIEASFQFQNDEIPNLTPSRIAEKLNQVAKEMADQLQKHIFETIMKEMEEVGRVYNSVETELNYDMFLKSIESTMLSFDRENKPNFAFFVSPELGEKLKPKLKIWNEDIELKKRFDLVMARKRDEWYARETSRKLVE
jgi:hypothetical protein